MDPQTEPSTHLEFYAMAQLHHSLLLASGRFPNRWALFPVGLLGILVSVQAVLFSLSRNDPSFAVEPEYYQKAVRWDEQVEQRAANTRLGWKAAVVFGTPERKLDAPALLQVTLLDADGRPLTDASVSATAFANARASDVRTLQLRPTEAGVYTGPVPVRFAGEWEVRLTAIRDGNTFTHTSRVTVPVAR